MFTPMTWMNSTPTLKDGSPCKRSHTILSMACVNSSSATAMVFGLPSVKVEDKNEDDGRSTMAGCVAGTQTRRFLSARTCVHTGLHAGARALPHHRMA